MTITTTCTEPNCTGSYEDGYCNVCGSPESQSAAAVAAVTGSPSAKVSATSSRLASTPIGSARSSGLTKPTRRIHSGTSVQQHLGAGITTVPSAPVPDPRSIVLANPSVAEEKRSCSVCGAPVGRSRDGRPGRTEGFCAKCQAPFSFTPKLRAGDMVGGQYEVVGCIAHGGLGWIYLARDKNVSDRYVVLKGLLNTGDADAFEAAVTERRFLAAVQHPLVLEIYNFASFDGAGYIVMEYVGGRSLKQILKDRMVANGNKYDAFPADQAIAYIIEILPAFSYLHSQGLIYCDFKPDNVIQSGDSLTLIDLGGVRRADDDQSAIYGTVGYQAPEVADVGTSIASDIYTIGRTLTVLAMEFRGYQSTFLSELPPVADTPLFQRYDSLYRVLSKACATNPDDRFQSADELRDQLIGVLREVVAIDAGGAAATSSTPSPLFGVPTSTTAALDWTELPVLRPDRRDNAADWLAGVTVADPAQRLEALDGAPERTVEVRLAQARAAVDGSMFDVAATFIDEILTDNAWEWRAVWLSGLAALARTEPAEAATAFNTVLGQVPGELAPKLALALACELVGDADIAEQLYGVCVATDASYVAAGSFGLARTRAGRHDVGGGLDALNLIGPTSGSYVAARRARADLLIASAQGIDALAEAVVSLDNVMIDPRDRQLILIQVLTDAIAAVEQSGAQPSKQIGGVVANDVSLRAAAEQAYRTLASLTSDRAERVALVDQANKIRPRTLV